MKKYVSMCMILLCVILAGCVDIYAYMPNTSTRPTTTVPTTEKPSEPLVPTIGLPAEPPVPTTSKPTDWNEVPVPPIDPAYFHKSAASAEELYAKLDKFPFDSAGSKERWQKILLNEHLAMLDSEIHRVDYEYLGFETDPLSGEVETIELFFHPKEHCSGPGDNTCSENTDAAKLYAKIMYKAKGYQESDFAIEGFDLLANNPKIFMRVQLYDVDMIGETARFIYFLDEHYVCQITVSMEYLRNHREVMEAFHEYLLSLVDLPATE